MIKRQKISNFQIIKLEPTCIIMRNKDTRKLYRYLENTHPIRYKNDVHHQNNSYNDAKQRKDKNNEDREDHSYWCHDLGEIQSDMPLVLPIIIQTGLLYERGISTLASYLNKQKSKQNSPAKSQNSHVRYQNLSSQLAQCPYTEQQIANTTQPIVRVVQFLHQRGIKHGRVNGDSIIIDQMGQVKVYYPGIPIIHSHGELTQQPEKSFIDDYLDIAKIIISMLGYDHSDQHNFMYVLRIMAKSGKFSKQFIFCLYCMLARNQRYINYSIDSLFRKQNRDINQQIQNEIQQLYQQELLQKNKKIQQSYPIKNNIKIGAYQPTIIALSQSPITNSINNSYMPVSLHNNTNSNNNLIASSKRIAQKVQFTPPLPKHMRDGTPKKIGQPTKRHIKIEDLQNKQKDKEKERQKQRQSKKKRPIQQVLKKVSNGKSETQSQNNLNIPNVNIVLPTQLTTTPTPATTTPTPGNQTSSFVNINIASSSPNYKNFQLGYPNYPKQVKQRQDLFKFVATGKRLRTPSRKKIG